MPRIRTILLATAALSASALAAHAPSGWSDEPLRRELSQPWKLGEAESLSLALDARGDSRVAWSADRPLGLEGRHQIADGVSLHVGGEALASADPVELSGRVPDWQAGAALRAKLDRRWTAGVGAGWRSASGLSRALDAGERRSAAEEGEGVVWLRLSASF